MSDVTLSFGGDSSELNQSLIQLRQTISAFSSQVKQQFVANSGTIANSFNSISKDSNAFIGSMNKIALNTASVFVGAKVAMSTLSGMFANLKGALTAAGNIELIRSNYIQFCGDVEKADALIEKLRGKAIKSPYETNDLLKSGNALLSAGVEAERVYDIVSSLAAVSSGSGQTLNELALSMAKGFAKGKFQTEQVGAFADRGINIMKALAVVTGKTGNELNKAIEKGLRFDQVAQAVASLSQEGGQFFGLMEKQGAEWIGLVSTMMGAIDELKISFATPIKDALKPYIKQINDLIGTLIPKAAEMGLALANAFNSVVTGAMSACNGVKEIVMSHKLLTRAVLETVALYALMKTGVVKCLWDIALSMKTQLVGALAKFKAQIMALNASFSTMRASSISTFEAIRLSAKTTTTAMIASFKTAFLAIKGALVSTGIGIALVALGELVAYFYGQFTKASSEAKQIQEQAADLAVRKGAESREIDSITEESSMIAKRKELEERIQELRDSLQFNKVEFSVAAIQGVQDEIMACEDLLRKLKDEVPARVAAAEATRKQQEETARLKQKLEEEQEQQKKNAEEIDKLIQKRDEEREKKMVDKLNLDQKTNYALTIANVTGLDELEAKIDRIKTRAAETGMVSDYDKQSLETLLRSRDLLDDIAEKRKESNETMYKEVESYSMRISLIQAELDGNTKRIRYLKEQQKIMEEMDKFRKAGFSDDAAEKMAKEIVKLEASKERNSNIASGVERYNGTTADSKSRVGGGGIGFTISVQPLLTESRKQTNVLEKIREYLPKLEAKQQSASAGTIGP